MVENLSRRELLSRMGTGIGLLALPGYYSAPQRKLDQPTRWLFANRTLRREPSTSFTSTSMVDRRRWILGITNPS